MNPKDKNKIVELTFSEDPTVLALTIGALSERVNEIVSDVNEVVFRFKEISERIKVESKPILGLDYTIPAPIKGDPGKDAEPFVPTDEFKKEIAGLVKVPVVEKVVEVQRTE